MKVTEAQLMNRIDYDLYQDGTGNGGKNLVGLAAAVPDAPSSGTYGGIDRGTWSFWQSKKYSGVTNGGVAVSAANIQQHDQPWSATGTRQRHAGTCGSLIRPTTGFYVNSPQPSSASPTSRVAARRAQASDAGSSAAAAWRQMWSCQVPAYQQGQ